MTLIEVVVLRERPRSHLLEIAEPTGTMTMMMNFCHQPAAPREVAGVVEAVLVAVEVPREKPVLGLVVEAALTIAMPASDAAARLASVAITVVAVSPIRRLPDVLHGQR